MKIIKVAIGLSILKLILHYFIGALWWNFNCVCLSTVVCLNVSFSSWLLVPTLRLPCSKRPRVGVSIARLISGFQHHSEGPKKCSDFSIQEPLLSWMCTSSSVKETGEDEACGVCLSGMRLSSGGGFFNPGSNNNSQSFTAPIPSIRRRFLKDFSFSGRFFLS